jgi:mRNA interferase RelE/StbE
MVSPAKHWAVRFERSAEKELRKLDPQIAKRLLDFLYNRVAVLSDPRSLGEALHGSELGNFWKYRAGDYRIIAEIHDAEIVIMVLHIGHRREVYR